MRPHERDGGDYAAHGAPGWPGWGPASGQGASPADTEPPADPAAPDPRLGVFIIVTAALLVIAAFLPWAEATPNVPDLGLLPGGSDEPLGTRDYMGVHGFPGMSVLIAALAAGLLGGAGAVLGRRLAAFAAIPALVMLAGLTMFAAWGHHEVVDSVYGDTLRRLPPPLGQLLRSTMETSLGFGWWLSLALALIMLGAGIVSLGRVPQTSAH
ncbi:MAG TPA: hypothetical protein VE465_22445 [Streptosporangiaceae bacterium]|nr:hypothetical protein [Streptosporangiaceae bacterium]